MSQPFIGEIRMFAGTFAPQGWDLCHGQLLLVSQNEALFSLLGTTYGGDGRTTFGLPDLRSRVPIHYGSGPGLTHRNLGAKVGTETATVSEAELPSHTHQIRASSNLGTTATPTGNTLATSTTISAYISNDPPSVDLDGDSISDHVGGGQAHHNIQPYLVINFIIALIGLYPSQT